MDLFFTVIHYNLNINRPIQQFPTFSHQPLVIPTPLWKQRATISLRQRAYRVLSRKLVYLLLGHRRSLSKLRYSTPTKEEDSRILLVPFARTTISFLKWKSSHFILSTNIKIFPVSNYIYAFKSTSSFTSLMVFGITLSDSMRNSRDTSRFWRNTIFWIKKSRRRSGRRSFGRFAK
jgi:hypothetical protein